MKKIFITGGAGFLGSNVVKRLVIVLMMLTVQVFFVYSESEFFPHSLRSWVYVVVFF